MRGNGLRRRSRGFTLVELAIVIAVTAILGSIAVITYHKYANKARFTQAQTALKHLQRTQVIYFTEHGSYTDNALLLDFNPMTYNYYTISIILDNTGYDFTGNADGVGVMAGDRWHINRDGHPIHDTPNF